MDISDPAKLKAALTYNAAADHFDDRPLGFWDRWGRRTVELLTLPPGSRVLDVCCGTGASALPAAGRIGPSGQVIAVDLAEQLLERGRRKAARRGLRNVEFRTGDMEGLGFPDAHFDAVICGFGIFFASDMARQVRELWRMVRRGGRLALTTWGPRIFEPIYSVYREQVKELRPDLYNAFNPWDRITTPEAVGQLLRDGGVDRAQITAEDGWQRLERPEDWWTIALGSGLRWTLDQLSPEARDQLRRSNLQWLRANRVQAIEVNVILAIATK